MDQLNNVVVWASVGLIVGLAANYALALFDKVKPTYLMLSSTGFGVIASFFAPECMCSNYKEWLVGTTLMSGIFCLVFVSFYVGFYLTKDDESKT